MKKRPYIFLCLIGCTLVLHCLAQESVSNIEFVENKGQWTPEVKFKGDISTGAFYLTGKGFTVLLHNPDDLAKITGEHHGGFSPVGTPGFAATKGPATTGAAPLLRSHIYRVSFVGGNESARIIPDKPLPSYNNYYIGHDPSKWASHCRIYQGITYKDVYPNIDFRYYSESGQLKYDIIVHPGGDVSKIALQYEGVSGSLNLRKNQLEINTTVGQVRELAPNSYQVGDSGRAAVSCKYHIQSGNIVRFKLGEHDPSATLVIDPALVFCSFTGSKASNWGFTATPGPDGSFFAGGIVFGEGYETSPGSAFPNYQGGGYDVGIIKFSSNGSTRVYATYLGGDDDDTPHSMICDEYGNLIVIGRTYSTNFPYITTAGPGGAADMFVAKFSGDGTKLTGCMRVGGTANDCVNIEDQFKDGHETKNSLIRNYGDDSRSEVIVDGSGNICIAASSQSSDFPIVGGFQSKQAGGNSVQDAVVLKIDPTCNHIIWSSFLGGSGDDAAFVIKPDPLTGDLYVAGATNSPDFPGSKAGVMQPGFAGGVCDGFVSIISADGTTLKKTTYLGTSEGEAIYGLQFDKKGFPYVMGTTNGSWTVTPNVGYYNAGAKQFISKLQPDLSGYVYSTVFGAESISNLPNISPVAFLVDRCENVYVSGWGGWLASSADPYGLSGTLGMPVTSNAVKLQTDGRDFYFIVLQKNASSLLYGTFYGQTDNKNSISEHVDGGTSRYDQAGVIYQGICANCGGRSTTPFPTTSGVWAPNNGTGGNGCNEAAVKISFGFAGVAGGLKVSANGRNDDTVGCIPVDALLQDTIRNAKYYIWNFGDGGPDTTTTSYVVSHTYPAPGRYIVMMVAVDTNSCNGRDTVYRGVVARTDKAILDFTDQKIGACESMQYEFTNLSTPPAGKPFNDSSFQWSFGDNSSPVVIGLGTVDHSYASPGTYIVQLVMQDTSYCNYPDTLAKSLRVSPLAKAQFLTPPYGCAPYTANFNNTSLGGLLFIWNFGDGSLPDSSVNPIHLYSTPGTYTVTLTEFDSTTCNKTSTIQETIVVSGSPTAGFSFAPDPPAPNQPDVFTNTSSEDAVLYRWNFGDGTWTMRSTADTVMHQFIQTDTFQVCLIAYNSHGCPDTACHLVPALINPLLDVPNAFTPGRFGQNAIIKVMGFGISRMIWKIYNRWGQLVFESNDPNLGWDGTYKGVVQPMDVYGYTLEAEFSDGKRITKKGDITLIR